MTIINFTTIRALTPPEIAWRYGVSPDKVVAWIRTGELRAVNVTANPRGRARWIIKPEALIDFERRRGNAAPPPPASPPRRRRIPKPSFEWVK